MRCFFLLAFLLPILAATSRAQSRSQARSAFVSPKEIHQKLTGIVHAAPAERKALHDRIVKLFGLKNLMQGRAPAKIEGTTVLWAVMDAKPAQVVRENGALFGEMHLLGEDGLQVLADDLPNFTDFRYRIEAGGKPRMAGSVRIEHLDYTRDSLPQSDVPQGRLEKFEWRTSKIFPDTVRDVTVYLPPNHKPGEETCLMIWQDGTRHADPAGAMRVPVVFDNLIHQQQMPRTVGIFIDPGRKPNQKPGDKAANRGLEYDSLGGAYARFLLEEIIPEVEKRQAVKLRATQGTWAIAGGSSGGICAFTAAWERPDKFGKVLSWVGSFVDIRGGHVYPSLIRITERKPIRVYLLGGDNDLDNPFGNWPVANKQMAAALKYMNYDSRIDWTPCFHGSKGMAPHLPEALRWLWRDVR